MNKFLPSRSPKSRNLSTNESVDSKPAATTQSKTGFIATLRFFVSHIIERRLTQVASSLTYTTILASVPLLAVILSLFTAFPLFDEFRVALEDFLTSSLMPPAVSDTVMTYLNQFAAKASGLTAIGSIFLIVTSIMLISTIDETFNDIWRVGERRPLTQRIFVYWAIISLGPILAGASLWASSLLLRESMGYVGDIDTISTFFLSYLPFFITVSAFTALYTFVPNRKVLLRDSFTGAVVTAICLEILKNGFAFYLTKFPTYTLIYGTFATIPIFLLWVYLSWLVVLVGATFTATLPDFRKRNLHSLNQVGAPFLSAVNMLYCLWLHRGEQPVGIDVDQIADQLNVDVNSLEPVLIKLKRIGYVANTPVGGHEHWVLACDPDQATLAPVIDILLLKRSLATEDLSLAINDLLDHSLAHPELSLTKFFCEVHPPADAVPASATLS